MKNLHHLLYFALFFFGLILITGCDQMEAPTAPTAADADQQSLLKSGHNDDNDDGDKDGRRRRHRYQAVAAPGITWSEAKAAAAAMKRRGCVGHLATITSQKENDFIVRHFPEAVAGGYWLGGFQPPGSVEPGGGWKWITGEPFIYTNWADGEPNNVDGIENALHFFPPFFGPQGAPGTWNDQNENNSAPLGGYVVEFDCDDDDDDDGGDGGN